MPGFDRTGPSGQGPRTGRGMGDCNQQLAPARPRMGGRGRGMGRRGFGGGGRGMGMRNRFADQVNPVVEVAGGAEIDELYSLVENLQAQIEELNNRLDQGNVEKEK